MTTQLNHKPIIFIGGLHKSGTSLTHRLLRAHPNVSGFANTGAPEDEGQHLQSVYPPAKSHGGPGRFAFDEQAHLTERSSLVSAAARTALLNDWGRHWDLSKSFLIEKSPPNLIRARFLQALFPGSKFVFIVRHPAAVAMATRKWSSQSEIELFRHWLVAHGIFLDDLTHLEHWAWLRYEDLVLKPGAILRELCDFIGLTAMSITEPIATDVNTRYLSNVEPSSDLVQPFHAGFASLMKHFGYKLKPPHYLLAPGQGSLVTND